MQKVAGAAVVVMMMLTSQDMHAQLISPGKLSAAHGELDGVRNCTACHQLRARGILDTKCLECHQPIATRMDAGAGLHATFPPQTCANCHKEHGGRELDILRFDSTTFDHTDAGFDLRGSHAKAECRDCHTPQLIDDAAVRQAKPDAHTLSRTFLGLGRTCTACHRDDDPHAGQFTNVTCEDCHNEERWSDASGFDHNTTRYPLTGQHRQVECQECHATVHPPSGEPFVRYRPLSFQACTSCHRDEHDGAMGTRCTDCHATTGWTRVNRERVENRFDHSTTGFLLVGHHANAPCASCHQFPPTRTPELNLTIVSGTERRTFPTPVANDCLSCHVDYHNNTFALIPGGPLCENCHDQSQWFPASYDLARHNRETTFPLTGAHGAVPCMACHVTGTGTQWVFQLTATACISCHIRDDPHQSQFFDRACDTCHNDRSFRIDDFDHSTTRFPLDKAHVNVPCHSCHVEEPGTNGTMFVRYTPLHTACRDCHGE